MDKKLREITNLGVEIMNSKRRGNLLTWCNFAFAVNVMLNLSTAFCPANGKNFAWLR